MFYRKLTLKIILPWKSFQTFKLNALGQNNAPLSLFFLQNCSRICDSPYLWHRGVNFRGQLRKVGASLYQDVRRRCLRILKCGVSVSVSLIRRVATLCSNHNCNRRLSIKPIRKPRYSITNTCANVKPKPKSFYNYVEPRKNSETPSHLDVLLNTAFLAWNLFLKLLRQEQSYFLGI